MLYMDPAVTSILIKILTEGGPVTMALGLLAIVLVKWIVPLVRDALSSHSESIQKLVDDHRAAQNKLVDDNRANQHKLVDDHRTEVRESNAQFRATLDVFVAQNNKLTDAIGGDIKDIRDNIDRLADNLTGIRSTLESVTGPTQRLDPRAVRGEPASASGRRNKGE